MSKKGGKNNRNGDDSNVAVPFSTKVSYIGTGVLIGLIAYPFVKKALGKMQPRMDELLDQLTGKAEGFAERAADIMAKAKDAVVKSEEASAGEDDHSGHRH